MTASQADNNDRATVRRAWLVAGLAAWLIAGVYIVSWALAHGLTDDATFSPYHLPAYAGLLTLIVAVLAIAGASTRARRGWRAPFGGGLEGIPLALALALLYIVADLVWSLAVGPLEGIEGVISPSRLLLPLVLGLIALAPLRVAWAHRAATGRRVPALAAAAVVGVALAAPAIGGAIQPFHPIATPWAARPTEARFDDTDVWTMAADGTRQTRSIRAGDGVEVSLPSWSPDGTRLAWTRWTVDGDGEGVGEVWVGGLDGSGATALTDGPATDWIPAWSRDGAWIAYTAERERAAGEALPMGALPQPGRAPGAAATDPSGSDLWLVRPDGTESRALTTMAGGEYLASWSPDGGRVAFGNQRDAGSGDLYIVDVATGAVTPLLERDGFDWAPAWSPDGSTIAFESDVDGSFDIWSMSVDGSNLRRLTDEGSSENHPHWSPDGSRIAYVSDQTGDGEIWAMAADGSNPVNLTGSPRAGDGYWGLDWSRDGTTLAYASAGSPPAEEHPLVRIDLAVAGVLIRAAVLAALAVLLVRVGPPFGAFTLLLAVDTAFAAAITDQWAFVPAAVAGGLIADLAVRQVRRGRAVVAGAVVPAAAVVAQAATLLALGTSAWSGTLWGGVIFAAALFGAFLGWLASGARTGADPRVESR